MRKPWSANEIVAALGRSNLPTILCEGETDAIIFRDIEWRLKDHGVDFIPCGGRPTLLKVFGRRHEFRGLPVVFVADRDMWLFTQVPREYLEIVFTDGYSIENDVVAWERLETLADSSEKMCYSKLTSCIVHWFASEVMRFVRGQVPLVDLHPRRIVDSISYTLTDEIATRVREVPIDDQIFDDLNTSFRRKVRGKVLLEALLMILSASSRDSKYSRANLLEMSVKSDPTPYYEALVTTIGEKLRLQTPRMNAASEPEDGRFGDGDARLVDPPSLIRIQPL